MNILWHDDEYEFKPLTLQGGKDKMNRNSNVYAPIFGCDTESVHLGDRYEPQCFTLSDPFGCDHLYWLPHHDFGLKSFLTFLIVHFDNYLFDEKMAFVYFHNLEYDWLQLVKNDPRLLEMARIQVSPEEDVELFRIGSNYVTLKKSALFAGSAPHFTIRIRRGKQSFSLFFRDSFSFFPSTLAKLATDLNLEVEKMERQEDIGQVDYRTIDNADERKIYFVKYSKIDAKVTRLGGEKIRDLHLHAGMKKIRASSPGYAINLLYHLMPEEISMITGTNDQTMMQLIFDTYRGGRAGGTRHGQVTNHSVYDFRSSYPASMCSLPSFNPDMAYIEVEDLRLENVLAILKETGNAFLIVSGTEIDSFYPSLITMVSGKLTPIYGDFKHISTTGVEFYVGAMSGSLTNITIHRLVVLLDMEENVFLPFRYFANEAYKRKAAAEKGNVEYSSAKLALTSAYGKLIESRTQTMIGARDYRVSFPFIAGMEKQFGNYYYSKYLEIIENESSLEEMYNSLLEEVQANFDAETYSAMDIKMFGDFSISGRIYGRHVNPAAASLITGISRARLVCGMKCLSADYWDTDSLFREDHENLDDSAVNELLKVSDSWLPDNIQPLRVGEELGDLGLDCKNASGVLSGIKRYYLTYYEFDKIQPYETEKGNFKKKYATHGIPALPKNLITEVLTALGTGEHYLYKSKPKPMKAKESKTKEQIGSFVSGMFKSNFHLDERLHWEVTAQGWSGKLKPFNEQGKPGMSEEQKQKVMESLYQPKSKKDR